MAADDPIGPGEAPASGNGLKRGLMRRSRRELLQTLLPVVALSLAAVFLTLHFVRPAPPHSLTMATGPTGSTFESIGKRYQKVLARSGIELKLLSSDGSFDNLARLEAAKGGADIALVQSGAVAVTDGRASELLSLGSIAYEPLSVFYRGDRDLDRLAQLKGRRIAIGPEGSGAHFLALAMLKANGIVPGGDTALVSLEGEDAKAAILSGRVDAAFLTGDTAAGHTVRELLHAPGLRLFEFAQADAYVRLFPYLSKLTVPAGAFDLGANLPAQPTTLLAPTVEIIARPGLHPALSDLLIEAAGEIHGRASLLQNAGQFPAPITHDFRLSADAARYYKSGKSLTYRYLPFWLATLVNRLVVVFVPLLLVAVPGLRFVPELYNWRVKRRIHHRYVELMALERRSLEPLTAQRRAELLSRLSDIERSVITVNVPGSHADQAYILRQHIDFVRSRLVQTAEPGEAVGG